MTTATAPSPYADIVATILAARDESKRRARSHRAKTRHNPAHDRMMAEYRAWRAAWELDCDETAKGYGPEGEDYRRDHPAPTFKAWLKAYAGERESAA